MTDRDIALNARAWPFAEARKLVARFETAQPDKDFVLFETGYGPSGLPHIGTFGEVARTSMVRHAFQQMSDLPTRLYAFSDDMDGLRKIPDNIPNKQVIAPHLGKPLTDIPDPFGTHESFGHHNNARLRAFLDAFGFDYAFRSATDGYRSGAFDETLLAVLHRYDAIIDAVLPTLRTERRKTYSPFLPVCRKTGVVLQVPVVERKPEAGAIVYRDVDGILVETPVTGGACKLQWKCDWAMRWVALGVDYEMSGKDLIDSVALSSRIAEVLGARPPEGFNYELFLDEEGKKISKSKGNGLTIDDWLRYAPAESLALFMYNAPRKAKRLYFDIIPRQVDDYLTYLEKYAAIEAGDEATRVENPAWHIHAGAPPTPPELTGTPIGFSMLLNLASACNAENSAVLWGFISRYAPDASPQTMPLLNDLAKHAVAYYHDFVKPEKAYRVPLAEERAGLEELAAVLRGTAADATADAIQAEVFEIGKRHVTAFPKLKDWFQALYQILLGQSQGPRFGSFVALYGVAETVDLIETALAREPAVA